MDGTGRPRDGVASGLGQGSIPVPPLGRSDAEGKPDGVGASPVIGLGLLRQRAVYDQPPLGLARTEDGMTFSAVATTEKNGSVTGSVYSYNSTRDMAQFVREIHGRIFNNLNDAYSMPADDLEWSRLNKQHSALSIAMGGLYPCPKEVEGVLAPSGTEQKRVLDVGCGSAIWTIQMALRFPHVDVLGIDLAPSPLDVTTLPPNVHFELDDINFGLVHYHNTFDMIHMRSVSGGIHDADKTMRDMLKCLKPGGLFLVVDGDVNLVGADLTTVNKLAKLPDDPDVSGVSESGSWLRRIMWEGVSCNIMAGCDAANVDKADEGLWQYDDIADPDTAGAGSVFLPVGSGARGKNQWENQVLGYVGSLVRQNFLNVHKAFHVSLLQYGMDQETLDQWSRRAEREINSPPRPSFVRFRFCWARRRAGDGLPAPPLPPPPPGTADTENDVHRYPAMKMFKTSEEALDWMRKNRASWGEVPKLASRKTWERIQAAAAADAAAASAAASTDPATGADQNAANNGAGAAAAGEAQAQT